MHNIFMESHGAGFAHRRQIAGEGMRTPDFVRREGMRGRPRREIPVPRAMGDAPLAFAAPEVPPETHL
jgi:hypothetical protein